MKSIPTGAEIDDEFLELAASDPAGQAMRFAGRAMLRIRDLEGQNAHLQAVVDFFRSALPWALRKSTEVERLPRMPWEDDAATGPK
jgi:hypothetical protein